MEEKTEQPTQKKVDDAREKGDVAKSTEVVSLALLIAISLTVFFLSDSFYGLIANLMVLPNTMHSMSFDQALEIMVDQSTNVVIYLLLPFLAVTFLTGIFANVGQTGPMFSTHSITPELKKISIASGLKKIFSVKNLVEFFKSILKIIVLLTTIVFCIFSYIGDLFNLAPCGEFCIKPLLGIIMRDTFVVVGLAFLVIAAFDFFFQKSQHIKQLKMSLDEVKREYKESEGDPEVKQHRKKFHLELLNGPSKAKVQRSTVVVTNPTHVSIGIFYKKGETALPVITAIGVDAAARQIKKLAKAADIPILENRQVARSLLDRVDVDDYIPSDMIEPVAEILLWVQRVRS